jgi:hypothetical protein
MLALASCARERLPIIDMHLHAYPVDWFPPGSTYCPGNADKQFPGVDPRKSLASQLTETCTDPFVAPRTSDDVMRQSLAALERYNIRAVTSGPLEWVKKWKAASPDRIIPALQFSMATGITPQALRELIKNGEIAVLGEVGT